MKICQHKDISPAQHLKIPLLDAYKYSVRFVLPESDFVDTFAGVSVIFVEISDSGNGDCGGRGVPWVENQIFFSGGFPA